jgi:hypothetical protein
LEAYHKRLVPSDRGQQRKSRHEHGLSTAFERAHLESGMGFMGIATGEIIILRTAIILHDSQPNVVLLLAAF